MARSDDGHSQQERSDDGHSQQERSDGGHSQQERSGSDRSQPGSRLPALRVGRARSTTGATGTAATRAPRRVRLKDRLFVGVCVLAAFAVVFLALSRGNPRAALIGGGLFLGYALLHSVVRRLEPAARLVTGQETDQAERMAQFRATRTAGQTALLVAVVGVALSLFSDWDAGLWVAGTAVLIVASFVVGLWWFGRSVS